MQDVLPTLFVPDRASTLEEKEELFWKQADFGYVKDVLDTVQIICKPSKKVSPLW